MGVVESIHKRRIENYFSNIDHIHGKTETVLLGDIFSNHVLGDGIVKIFRSLEGTVYRREVHETYRSPININSDIEVCNWTSLKYESFEE